MNRRNRGANTNTNQILIDMAVLGLAFLFDCLLTIGKYSDREILKCFSIAVIFTVICILANKQGRIYDVTLFFYLDRFYKIITKSWLIASVSMAVILFVYNPSNKIRNFYYLFIATAYIFMAINTIFSRFIQTVTTRYQAPRAVFVGVFEEYEKFNYFLNKTSMRIDEIGYVLRDHNENKGVGIFNVLGYMEELEDIIRENEVDQVYFMVHKDESPERYREYADLCLEMGVTVRMVLDSHSVRRTNSFVSSIGIYPMITYHTITLNTNDQLFKRVVDFVSSLLGLIILSPLLLIVAIIIKLDSPGPVIFKQLRVGQNGRNFYMYKFRSMVPDAEEKKKELMEQNEVKDGMMFKMKNDPRVTRFGRFIRKTSIDELPQLFNVLKGEMSLVGTRPPTLDEVQKYHRGQWRRISIKPGITGLWQVTGRSDITDFDKVVELDLEYIDNWTPFLDIRILFATVLELLKHKGAY